MKNLQILQKLQNAYGASTEANNKFAKALNSVAWDNKFQADGESYFVKGDLIVTVQSTNPFRQLWKPSFVIGNYYGEF